MILQTFNFKKFNRKQSTIEEIRCKDFKEITNRKKSKGSEYRDQYSNNQRKVKVEKINKEQI